MDRCTWKWDEDVDGGVWVSACGMSFGFDYDSPALNGFKFCPKCGKPLEEEEAP